MNSDPLGDFFTRLRNGAKARQALVIAPYSRIKEDVAKVLKAEGYISNYTVEEQNKKKTLLTNLKFNANGQAVLEHIKRLSKPSQRVYVKTDRLKTVRSGLGLRILSTSKGIMTDRQAKAENAGGELLGEVW